MPRRPSYKSQISTLAAEGGRRVVIQCGTDTHFKPFIWRQLSFILSDTTQVYGMCVHECLGVSVGAFACDWTNDRLLMCPSGQ